MLAATAHVAACGGGATPEPKTADEQGTRHEHAGGPGISASAEIGALDEAKVTATFQAAQGALQRCVATGAARNEMEGGDIAFFVKIGEDGRIVHAHAERSTIGDRETEKCMLDALRSRSWPAPVGGKAGLARNSFGFDMPNDVRPPTAWEPGRVEGAVASLTPRLSECKQGVKGELTATVYVDPEGAVTSAGVAASDESGEGAADCVTSVLKGARFPSPGSWPAKVTFPL